jgi:hypothetical protein
MANRPVYVAITKSKVHAFPSWARWMEVKLRADKMGATAEWVQTRVSSRKTARPVKVLEAEILREYEAKCRVHGCGCKIFVRVQ